MWNSNTLDKSDSKLPSELVNTYRILAIEDILVNQIFNETFENSFWFSKTLKDKQLLELLSFSTDENVIRIKEAIIYAFVFGGTYQSIINILYAVFTPDLNIEILNLDGTDDSDNNPFFERGDIRINISNTGINASTGIVAEKPAYEKFLDASNLLDNSGVLDPIESVAITGIVVKNDGVITGILSNKFVGLGGVSVEDFILKFIPPGCRLILSEV